MLILLRHLDLVTVLYYRISMDILVGSVVQKHVLGPF